jgi:RecA/RadA recombinase
MPRMPVTELNRHIAQLQAKLNKQPAMKGAKVMDDIHEAPNTYFLRRPSGIMQLDIDTGGGLPAGGLTYLSGPDGVGKSVLLYKYVAMNQRLLGPRSAVALGLAEAAADHFFMRKCGIQMRIPEEMIEERVAERKLRGAAPFSKEDLAAFRQPTVGAVKIVRGATGEELLGGVLECFDANCFDIVSCDSISAVLPEADAGKSMDENEKRAAAAGLVTKFFKHYLNGTTGYYGRNETTVIFISQVRSNSKKAEAPAHIAKYLPDYAPQGAWAAKHGKLIDILLKPGEKEKENAAPTNAPTLGALLHEREKKKKVQIGKAVRYEILKGKAGVHDGITGEYDFDYSKIVDDQRLLIVTALSKGVAIERDGLVTVLDHATGKPFEKLNRIAGIDNVTKMLREDFELELTVRRSILSAVGIECAYR